MEVISVKKEKVCKFIQDFAELLRSLSIPSGTETVSDSESDLGTLERKSGVAEVGEGGL